MVRLDEKRAMKCLVQILNGFGELTKNGITHRDLKP
jgi:serine/threonine protein kinase